MQVGDFFAEVEATGLDGFKSPAEKLRSTDEPLEVDAAVLHREALVVQKQLLLAIEDDVLGVQLVDALLEGGALDLKLRRSAVEAPLKVSVL